MRCIFSRNNHVHIFQWVDTIATNSLHQWKWNEMSNKCFINIYANTAHLYTHQKSIQFQWVPKAVIITVDNPKDPLQSNDTTWRNRLHYKQLLMTLSSHNTIAIIIITTLRRLPVCWSHTMGQMDWGRLHRVWKRALQCCRWNPGRNQSCLRNWQCFQAMDTAPQLQQFPIPHLFAVVLSQWQTVSEMI